MLDRLDHDATTLVLDHLLSREALHSGSASDAPVVVARRYERNLWAVRLVARGIGELAQYRLDRLVVIVDGTARTRRRLANLQSRFADAGDARIAVDLLVVPKRSGPAGQSYLCSALRWIRSPVEYIGAEPRRDEADAMAERLDRVRTARLWSASRASVAVFRNATVLWALRWLYDEQPLVVEPNTGLLLAGGRQLRHLRLDELDYQLLKDTAYDADEESDMQLSAVLNVACGLISLDFGTAWIAQLLVLLNGQRATRLTRLLATLHVLSSDLENTGLLQALVQAIPATMRSLRLGVNVARSPFTGDVDLLARVLLARCRARHLHLHESRLYVPPREIRAGDRPALIALASEFRYLGVDCVFGTSDCVMALADDASGPSR